MGRSWIKMWCRSLDDESDFRKMSLEERGFWVSLLLLAGKYALPDGTLAVDESIPLTPSQIASGIGVNYQKFVGQRSRLVGARLLEWNPKTKALKIVNWPKYQSEYQRQKPYRQRHKEEEEEAAEEESCNQKLQGGVVTKGARLDYRGERGRGESTRSTYISTADAPDEVPPTPDPKTFQELCSYMDDPDALDMIGGWEPYAELIEKKTGHTRPYILKLAKDFSRRAVLSAATKNSPKMSEPGYFRDVVEKRHNIWTNDQAHRAYATYCQEQDKQALEQAKAEASVPPKEALVFLAQLTGKIGQGMSMPDEKVKDGRRETRRLKQHELEQRLEAGSEYITRKELHEMGLEE